MQMKSCLYLLLTKTRSERDPVSSAGQGAARGAGRRTPWRLRHAVLQALPEQRGEEVQAEAPGEERGETRLYT